jgi:cysteine desulfurase/selenocysteine lyase
MNIRKDFPILEKKIIYVDSACMSLKPVQVVRKMNEYYTDYPACEGRSSHKLAVKLSEEVYLARRAVKKFINAKLEKEIIFTRNTTEGINLVANSFALVKGDSVLITEKEHNSNLVPWLKLKEERGVKLLILKLNDDGSFNFDNYKRMLEDSSIRLVSFCHSSNVDGVAIPAKEIIKLAHDKKIKVMLDGAQSAPHKKIDVQDLGVDFFAFSGHKMMGPSGIGVLYGKAVELETLKPFIVGGETVKNTFHDSAVYEDIPMKFEAGLQNYSGIIGLGEACRYLSEIGVEKIAEHEIMLNRLLTEKLKGVVKIIGPENPGLRGGVFNFYIDGIDMKNFSIVLDSSSGIMTRAGSHCVHSYYNARKIPASTRISFYAYNTEEEAVRIADEIIKLVKCMK